MKRQTFGKVAVAFSTILCVASVAAWVTSEWRELRVEATREGWTTQTLHEAWSLELGAWDGRFGVRWGVTAGAELFDPKLRATTHLPTGWKWQAATSPIDESEWQLYDLGSDGVAVPNSPWMAIWRSDDADSAIPSNQVEVTMPMAAITIATGLLPAVAFWRRLRRGRRTRAKQCNRCGYDVRGSPGRCSECGTAVG